MSVPTSPDRRYPGLFDAVQSSGLFPDSKTFVDAIARKDPVAIEKEFQARRGEPGFDLGDFVSHNFELPGDYQHRTVGPGRKPVRDHIETLWQTLTRAADDADDRGSLIALPRPYVVPGGRFREIYYWDSYFTMLGLASQGKEGLVENMVENFAYLIDQVGFVPNGNRTYFCSRSQPPFFSLMVELLAQIKSDKTVYARYLPQLDREHAFWMDGASELGPDCSCIRRVVAVPGGVLNRYWDDLDTARPESYSEDQTLAKLSGREPAALYRDLRAACESGWDFSSRWLEQPDALASVRTTRIVPVDLNCLMYKLESVLATAHKVAGNPVREEQFAELARRRRDMVRQLFFDHSRGCFGDLLLPDLEFTHALSLATMYPLYFELVDAAQAAMVAESVSSLLRQGGWVTTAVRSGQQWDAPNGWAPLQWVTFRGLHNYGFKAEAEEGARRWVDTNCAIYERTGRLLEKYDVEEISRLSGGGEYALQDGFGWTNAILLRLIQCLEEE